MAVVSSDGERFRITFDQSDGKLDVGDTADAGTLNGFSAGYRVVDCDTAPRIP
jgi:hypothetical protein